MSKIKALFRLASLPQTALAALALGAAGSALAQTGNVANGNTLYNQKIQTVPNSTILLGCVDCHGAASTVRGLWAGSPRNAVTEDEVFTLISNSINSFNQMSTYRSWTPQQRRDVAAYVVSSAPAPGPAPTPPPPPGIPPTPAASPNPVGFNTMQVGVRSPRTGVLVTNASASTITLASPYVLNAGGDSTDFWLAPAPAGGPQQCQANLALAPGGSCAIGAEFQPTATGSRTANWSINFQAGVLSRLVTLQGSGSTAPAPAPTPTPTPSPSPSPGPAPAPAPAAAESGGASGPTVLAGLLAMLFASGLRRRRDD